LVPLVIAGRGIVPGFDAEQVQGIDVLPTLASLLGVRAPAGLPGQNLLAPRETRVAISQTHWGVLPDGSRADLVSVRTPTWKLIWDSGEHYEVYNLRDDPGERHDWSIAAPEGAALARELVAWRAATPPAAA